MYLPLTVYDSQTMSDRSDSPPPLEPADSDYVYEPDQFGDILTYRDRPVCPYRSSVLNAPNKPL